VSAKPRKTTVGAGELVFALAVAAVAAPGMLYGARGEPDPLAALVWVTLIAVPGGYACGARGIRLWPLALVVPVGWMMVVALADALSARDLPLFAASMLPVLGMFGAGFAIGSCAKGLVWRGAGALFLLVTLLAALPLAGLVLREPWKSHVAARVLDLAPTTLVAECAGVDWMRQGAIYEGSSTVDIDPSVRTSYDWRRGGVIVLVVGGAAALVMERVRRRGTPVVQA
jgi:hypothetical protein